MMGARMLTKSDYMSWRECPLRLWLEKKRKDLLPSPDPGLEEVFAQGREVDDFARRLFPGGIEVSGFNAAGWAGFQRLLGEGHGIFYQPSVVTDGGFACRADIVVRDGRTGALHLLEVKSSTRVKDNHLYDVAFQRLCFKDAGLPVSLVSVVHLNKDFVRHGEIDSRRILTVRNVTDEAAELEAETRRARGKALAVLGWDVRLTPERLVACPHDTDCPWREAFLSGVAGDLTENLSAWPRSAVVEMLEAGIVSVNRLPADLRPGFSGVVCVDDACPPPVVRHEALREELDGLEYPLYFLDYETYSPALPWYDGYSTYQRIPFQFSLDIVDKPGAATRHVDFLADDDGDPSASLVAALRAAIGPRGRLVSWNAVFEKGVNDELARRLPRDADFLLDLNERMYDLMLVFRRGRLYSDPRCRGSASLKAVAPALIGDPYAGLGIKAGGAASAAWPKLVGRRGEVGDPAAMRRDMLEYCAVDTMSMVRILNLLRKTVSHGN